MNNPTNPILIVEDDENDALLLTRAVAKAGLTNPVIVLRHGREAVQYLQGDGPYTDRVKYPFPRVLITDLKMPIMTGFELLTWLSQHPACSIVPTIVLSSSREKNDITEAYRLGANAYLVKPSTIKELEEMMDAIFQFWFRWCEKPDVGDTCL